MEFNKFEHIMLYVGLILGSIFISMVTLGLLTGIVGGWFLTLFNIYLEASTLLYFTLIPSIVVGIVVFLLGRRDINHG